MLTQGRCAVINPHILHKWPKIKPALYLIQPDILHCIFPLNSNFEIQRSVHFHFQEGKTDLTVQSCLLDPVSIDLSMMDMMDKKSKPSYMTSLVEEWRTHDNSKTLSDGAEWEESAEEEMPKEKAPTTLTSEKNPAEELPRPSVKGRVEGLLDEGKLSGEARLLELIAHPAVGLLAVCLACLRTSTNLDLLTAFGLLLTIVAHISLLFH